MGLVYAGCWNEVAILKPSKEVELYEVFYSRRPQEEIADVMQTSGATAALLLRIGSSSWEVLAGLEGVVGTEAVLPTLEARGAEAKRLSVYTVKGTQLRFFLKWKNEEVGEAIFIHKPHPSGYSWPDGVVGRGQVLQSPDDPNVKTVEIPDTLPSCSAEEILQLRAMRPLIPNLR